MNFRTAMLRAAVNEAHRAARERWTRHDVWLQVWLAAAHLSALALSLTFAVTHVGGVVFHARKARRLMQR